MGDKDSQTNGSRPAEYKLDVKKHARYFQMVLNGIPSKSQDMQRALIAYFCLCGLEILGELDRIEKFKPQIVEWLKLTQMKQNGCFRGSTTFSHASNDLDTPHLTMTSISLLSLLILGEDISKDDVLVQMAETLFQFQKENGCFQATLLPSDEFDVRFIYSAACIYKVLEVASEKRNDDKKSVPKINIDSMAVFLESCFTYEGSVTVKPELEGHAGGVYCSLASLVLTGQLDRVLTVEKREALIKWLLNRQNDDGGFNGRPNKPSDSCYFFWVGASLALLGAIKFVDPKSVLGFCQSVEDTVIGGFSKLPGCVADPMHSYLTLAGLSLLGTFDHVLAPINPELCCPQRSLTNFLAK